MRRPSELSEVHSQKKTEVLAEQIAEETIVAIGGADIKSVSSNTEDGIFAVVYQIRIGDLHLDIVSRSDRLPVQIRHIYSVPDSLMIDWSEEQLNDLPDETTDSFPIDVNEYPRRAANLQVLAEMDESDKREVNYYLAEKLQSPHTLWGWEMHDGVAYKTEVRRTVFPSQNFHTMEHTRAAVTAVFGVSVRVKNFLRYTFQDIPDETLGSVES
jgi:hypothetical protein